MEYLIITIVTFMAIYYLLKLIMYKKEESEPIVNIDTATEEGNESSEDEYPSTVEVVCEALQAIGCQPEIGEHNILSVSYQGELFEFNFSANLHSRYIRVWNPCWASILKTDPNFELVQEAVNITNFNYGPTIVMTAPNDDNVVSFHSRYDIMIHPTCPDNVIYIKSVLDSFFPAKEAVRGNFHDLTITQAEQRKNRRPIGIMDET